MKKAILLFISVFLICSMLALTACSSDQVTNENEGSVTENTENAEENTEENAEEESEIAFTDSVGLNYYLNDDATGYTVYGIGSFKGDCLVIPEVYNGLPVVNIDEYAFSGCDQIKTLVISKNIKKIAYKAFYDCTMLEEIYFRAENMEDLEENNKVFYNAGKSTEGISVFFGKDVVRVPAYLFNPFSNLYTPNIKKMSFWKVSECTYIGKYAFSGCDALTNVDIPEKIESIDICAFASCPAIKEINYASTVYKAPETLVANHENVFYNSANGATVTIAKAVKTVPPIFGYSNISYLTFEDNSSCETISEYAFTNCFHLLRVELPKNIKEIKSCAFNGCPKLIEIKNLSNLDITAGRVTNGFIGFSARNIITENVEESAITKNEDGFVFYNNDNKSLLISYEGDLEEITLPDTHEYEIYGFAFLGCKKLTAVTIGDNVKRIGILAFYKCENLSSVIIGNGVETISYSAFKNCASLKTLALGTGLKNIYRGAFDICDGIESILFTGPFSQFKNIAIAEEGNDIFTTAKITYNAKLEPPVEE